MTPAKRRATPASQGPTRTAPDVPIVDPTPVAPADTTEGTQLLGPEGEPIAQEAATGDASADSAPPMETGQVDADGARTHSPRRSGAFYPLPVWPD